MDVIGVGGQAQNGKDTLADYLRTILNESIGYNVWKRDAFASNVKRIFCESMGVDAAFIEKWKTNSEPPPEFDMAIRKGLQFIGDGFRKIKGNIWVDMLFDRMKDPTIISDVRYPNELDIVRKKGGVNILIIRPDRLNDDPNGSESFMRTLADWCLAHLDQYQPYYNMCAYFNQTDDTAPKDMYLVDFVVFNNSTIEALYQKVDLLRPELEQIRKSYANRRT
jgi:rhodanese-related sulfurtransferase